MSEQDTTLPPKIEKEFDDLRIFRGTTRGDLDYISEKNKKALKSFLVKVIAEVLKEAIHSLDDYDCTYDPRQAIYSTAKESFNVELINLKK
jgi:hypothetical protein